MKKLFFIVSVLAFVLSACAAQPPIPKTAVPNAPAARAADALVQLWIKDNASDNTTKADDDKLLAALSDDFALTDISGSEPSYTTKAELEQQYAQPASPTDTRYLYVYHYTIPLSGEAAVIWGSMHVVSSTVNTTVPITIILEFKDGKIWRQTIYYEPPAYAGR